MVFSSGKMRRSFSRKWSSGSAKIDEVVSGDHQVVTEVNGTHSPAESETPTQAAEGISVASEAATATESDSPQQAAGIEEEPAEVMPRETDLLKSRHDERVLVVGKGVVLTADVTSCDKVVIEGQFQGNIKTHTFILSEATDSVSEVKLSGSNACLHEDTVRHIKLRFNNCGCIFYCSDWWHERGGNMEGEVRCADGCIGGNMKATIVASKTLLIGDKAVVTGDMVYDSLQVVDGGRLQGKLTHYSSIKEGQSGEGPEIAQASA